MCARAPERATASLSQDSRTGNELQGITKKETGGLSTTESSLGSGNDSARTPIGVGDIDTVKANKERKEQATFLRWGAWNADLVRDRPSSSWTLAARRAT